jgi:adenosylcobinamide-phosphate synthase
MNRIPGRVLIAGYAADLTLGDPARFHPVGGFGAAAGTLERAVWRPSRTVGALYAVALVGAAGVVGVAIGRVSHAQTRVALAAACLWAALGGRSLELEARRLARLVGEERLIEARDQARTLVGRDTAGLDGPDLSRAAIESVAENTVDAVIGPCLWTVVGGPAGMAAYRAANTLDAMVGHRSERHERFGWAAARLDDALTWPAARLGAGLAAALAPSVGGSPGEAWRVLRRDGGAHPSPNAGRLEAAFAGALGLTLGGTNDYDGRVEHRPKLGDGRAPAPSDVERSIRLSSLVGAAAVVLCAALTSALGRRAEVRR